MRVGFPSRPLIMAGAFCGLLALVMTLFPAAVAAQTLGAPVTPANGLSSGGPSMAATTN
jgi:hypothetical protein